MPYIMVICKDVVALDAFCGERSVYNAYRLGLKQQN